MTYSQPHYVPVLVAANASISPPRAAAAVDDDDGGKEDKGKEAEAAEAKAKAEDGDATDATAVLQVPLPSRLSHKYSLYRCSNARINAKRGLVPSARY
jgi:hypothetical protein